MGDGTELWSHSHELGRNSADSGGRYPHPAAGLIRTPPYPPDMAISLPSPQLLGGRGITQRTAGLLVGIGLVQPAQLVKAGAVGGPVVVLPEARSGPHSALNRPGQCFGSGTSVEAERRQYSRTGAGQPGWPNRG